MPSVRILDVKKTLVFNVYITFWQDMLLLLAVLAFESEIETDECWSSMSKESGRALVNFPSIFHKCGDDNILGLHFQK